MRGPAGALSAPAAPVATGSATDRRHLLRQMLRIRRFEERCVELYDGRKIRGDIHLYIGEEAVAAGVMAALIPADAVVATHRAHGQALARGISAESIMAELYGRVTGCSRGRGGSTHLFDAGRRFYGGNATGAGGLPLAVGLALADAMTGRRHVTCCFFGDGALAEGEFHECLNLASLWRLPVLFCCENNLYAGGTRIDRAQANPDLANHAASYGITASSVDGMDVLAVVDAARAAATAIRFGDGPQFLELRTYRYRAHSGSDPDRYRDPAEIAAWRQRDPIDALTGALRRAGELTDADLATIEAGIGAEIDAAVSAAEAAGTEPVEALTRFVYSEGSR